MTAPRADYSPVARYVIWSDGTKTKAPLPSKLRKTVSHGASITVTPRPEDSFHKDGKPIRIVGFGGSPEDAKRRLDQRIVSRITHEWRGYLKIVEADPHSLPVEIVEVSE